MQDVLGWVNIKMQHTATKPDFFWRPIGKKKRKLES